MGDPIRLSRNAMPGPWKLARVIAGAKESTSTGDDIFSAAGIERPSATASTEGGIFSGLPKWMRDGVKNAPKEPGPAPDLTDEVVQAAARAESKRLQVGRTRKSTFLTPMDAGNARKTLLGG